MRTFFKINILSALICFCFQLSGQTTDYTKEIAKANKWNQTAFATLKQKFCSDTKCELAKVNCQTVKTQYDLYGEKSYGGTGFNQSQKAHDKVVARQVKVSGCGKEKTYSFASGKWEVLSENTKPAVQ
ncbi:MAG: hypothetical protein IT236_15210 [Bacteroidia bacterium]|nr:hypothetical protein [Bacteroidia bacterium]